MGKFFQPYTCESNRVENKISYELIFPDGNSIEGKSKPTKEEAIASLVEAFDKGITDNNGKNVKPLYPYWG